MKNLTFKPKMVTKRLLSVLPDRARDVLIKRYGLGKEADPATLEAIGQEYGITRERVRQIENYALAAIRKSDVVREESAAFKELVGLLDDLGAIVPEEEFLTAVSKDATARNHIHFLLVVGEAFTKEKENAEFHHRWFIDTEIANAVQSSLRSLYQNLADDDLIPESEIIDAFLKEIRNLNNKYKNEEVVKRWLSISKQLGKNPLGEWGKAESSNVKAKGMRDFAYLVIKRHGSPMHFREVAKAITELFNRKAHEATCHNELIKDARFVLVGRGMYALKEWGYASGAVKDVIASILQKYGPLTRDEVIEQVRKERYVKDNTILINLQDLALFKRENDGRYTLRT